MHIMYISLPTCDSSTTRRKAASNFKKHGVSFSDAEGVLKDSLAVTVEDPDAEGENGSLQSAWEVPIRYWWLFGWSAATIAM